MLLFFVWFMQDILKNVFFFFLQESEDLRDRMMTMEAELRSLREELSHRGGSSASATSSLESDAMHPLQKKRALTPTTATASSTAKAAGGEAASAVVTKKKLAAANHKERQLSLDSLEGGKETPTAKVAQPQDKQQKLGSNGEISTGSEEESGSDQGDPINHHHHLAGPEKRLSLQDEDIQPQKDKLTLENTDGNAEIEDDEEESGATASTADPAKAVKDTDQKKEVPAVTTSTKLTDDSGVMAENSTVNKGKS